VIYKSIADGKYYLLIEHMKDGRYYELWQSSSAGGPWTQVAEKWAWRGNLKKYNADKWTTNVSHGELVRAGYDQKLEINDINKVDFLIQGTTDMSPQYQQIIWDLGLIRNYDGTGPDTPVVVTPKSAFDKLEAEKYDDQSGIEIEDNTDGNGKNIGYIQNGDYAVYKKVDFGSGAANFQASAGSGSNGGNIEIRLDSLTGTLIGTCAVSGTGGWKTWADAACNVSGVTGEHDIYLKFTGESDYLFNLDWFKFGSEVISEGKLGDINSDDSIDSLDLMMIKKHLLGEAIENTALADLDGSGAVDAIDFALMKQYLLGIITAFPGQK
jgi:hypothetical protein